MLVKIKNILKIIISVLIIFCCMKSCAKASVNMSNFHEDNKPYNDYDLFNQLVIQTFNEDYEELNVNTNNITQYQDTFNYFLDSNYIACYLENNTTGVICNLSYNDTFQNTKIASISVTKYQNGTYRISSSILNNTSSNLNGTKTDNTSLNKFLRLNSQWYNTTWNTLDYSPISFSFTIATNYSITNYLDYGQTNAFKYSYNNNQWLLGTMQGLEDITEVEFKLINLETNQNIAQCYKTGSISNMRISNNQLLLDSYIVYKDTPYRLYYDVYIDGEIVDSFWYNIVFLDRNAVITNGVITNYGSGENYNIQNQTQQEQNFWQETYEKLFTISGDFVNEKFEEIKQTLNLSGDYETEQAFINLINENNGDFVIGWQSFSTPYFSLSGDNINFSQLERENAAFQETMRLGSCINRFQPNSIVN